MRLEIDMPEHHYNNIMTLDSVNLGRVPYKGIIMYAINAIKHGKVLEQEPTTKNDLGVDAISRDEVCRYVAEFVNHEFSTKEEEELIDNIITGIEHMPSVTPQEPILDKIRAEIDKIYEREGNSVDCLNALDELKLFIDKYKAESVTENGTQQ